jgi:niacin transporter
MPQKNFRESPLFPLTAAALLLAIGVLMPQAFHVFGQAAGKMFLPMHLMVLLTGLYLGPWWGLTVGAATPLISFLFTQMPAAALLPFMCAELAAYGLFVGIFCRRLRWNVYPALICAQLAGRLLEAGIMFLCADVLGIQGSARAISVWSATIAGAWGILIQLVLLPPLFLVLNRLFPLPNREKESENNAGA